jgi:hypothetical protein
MHKQLIAAILFIFWCFVVPASYAVELVVTERAATTAFRDAAFKRDRKYDLIRPSKCSYTYLEQPEVGFANDRVSIRLHLSARAGQEVAGQCVGAGEAFWFTVAGTPFVEGTTVGVKDPHVVQLDNPSYRVLLEAALKQGLMNGLRHDVGASVRAALAKDVNHYRLTVNNLALTNLRARDNVLRATIDFELAGDAAQ